MNEQEIFLFLEDHEDDVFTYDATKDVILEGALILKKYVVGNVFQAAGSGIIYGPDLSDVVDKINEEDLLKLAKYGWDIYEQEYFAHTV